MKTQKEQIIEAYNKHQAKREEILQTFGKTLQMIESLNDCPMKRGLMEKVEQLKMKLGHDRDIIWQYELVVTREGHSLDVALHYINITDEIERMFMASPGISDEVGNKIRKLQNEALLAIKEGDLVDAGTKMDEIRPLLNKEWALLRTSF